MCLCTKSPSQNTTVTTKTCSPVRKLLPFNCQRGEFTIFMQIQDKFFFFPPLPFSIGKKASHLGFKYKVEGPGQMAAVALTPTLNLGQSQSQSRSSYVPPALPPPFAFCSLWPYSPSLSLQPLSPPAPTTVKLSTSSGSFPTQHMEAPSPTCPISRSAALATGCSVWPGRGCASMCSMPW